VPRSTPRLTYEQQPNRGQWYLPVRNSPGTGVCASRKS
jgi:hypothetical protein